MQGLDRLGSLLSLAYLGAYSVFVFLFIDLSDKPTINELGDALAGAFAPLAFLWLVLGFYQQGRELKNSTDALNLQVKELRASVEQSERLVQVTGEQLALDREVMKAEQARLNAIAEPKLRLRKDQYQISGTIHKLHMEIVNIGGECHDLVGEVLCDKGRPLTTFAAESLTKEDIARFKFDVDASETQDAPIFVKYIDQQGMEHSVRFDVTVGIERNQAKLSFPSIPRKLTDC